MHISIYIYITLTGHVKHGKICGFFQGSSYEMADHSGRGGDEFKTFIDGGKVDLYVNMYLCSYMYLYICIYKYVSLCLCKYVYTYVSIYIRMYV
jgi:hypothetical protein